MKPIRFFTTLVIIIVVINASTEVLGQTSEIPVSYVTHDGAIIILDIQHSFTDPEYVDQTVAIYLAFTSDIGIEAAMFFLYLNNEASVYWMVGNPTINPWNWIEGIEDQHYYFDDSSTITLIFIEFTGISDPSINLQTYAKILPDFSFDSAYVDFPLLLSYFPIVIIPSSQTTSTTQKTSISSITQTSTSTIISSGTSQESTFTGLTSGFSSIVLIGALFFVVYKKREKN